MRSHFLRLLFVLFVTIGLSLCIHAQTLKADYQFQGNLNSSVGIVPSLNHLVANGNGQNTFVSDNVDGYSRQVLNFSLNNGVSINDFASIVPNTLSATVVVLFKFTDVNGRRRLVDFSAGTEADNGGFLSNGKIEGEIGSHVATDSNSYFQLVFVRGTGSVVAVYRDAILATSDPDDGTPLMAGIRFFQDWAGANPIQASAGSIARLRVYDGPLTLQQLHQLDRVPEMPSGQLPVLFYSNRNGVNEMFRMNSDGSSQKRVTNNEVLDYVGKFSPDGQKIVYQRRETASDPFQIWVSNIDGSNPVRLTNSTTIDKAPSWRPDGLKILFSRCINGGSGACDLFTMDPNGANQAAVSTTVTDEDQATYTPNGAKLVFACSDQNLTNYQICVSNADGSGRVAITNTTAPALSQFVNISPNGLKLACIQGSGAGNNVIKTMNLDGSGVITWSFVNNPQFPLWSPDGTKIMYSAISGNQFEIFTANPDGTSPTQITFNSSLDIATDWYRSLSTTRRSPFDFDGDGKTDVGIFRPGLGEWWYLRSLDGVNRAFQFGQSTDKIVAADYTGDGKTDVGFFRPSSGEWYILRSEDGSFYSFPFGNSTDIPTPADFDGDGKIDPAIYRPSNSTWFILRSSDGGTTISQFGANGDLPVAADYDGDGKADLAIFRPSNGSWWLNRSQAGLIVVNFGTSTDRTVQADYTGDGKADVAFFRPSTREWFVLRSEDFSFYSAPFGAPGDIPTPGDYDGDGYSDLAIFRPSTNTWYLQRSTSGFTAISFGAANDIPIPNAYVR